MATAVRDSCLLSLFVLFTLLSLSQGSRNQVQISYFPSERAELLLQKDIKKLGMINERRSMIGSVAPICTYNECRGCKFKCRAEQVPVEGNDPINSPYHYKCVCHR